MDGGALQRGWRQDLTPPPRLVGPNDERRRTLTCALVLALCVVLLACAASKAPAHCEPSLQRVQTLLPCAPCPECLARQCLSPACHLQSRPAHAGRFH